MIHFIFLLMLLPSRQLQEIPVLCYHQVSAAAPAHADAMHISSHQFDMQLKTLADSGYHPILPFQLFLYLTEGQPLPTRPVLVTFDDGHKEHFTTAAPILEKYKWRGVFFIMTVTIGKQGYLTREDIRLLHEHGHIIGSHTWDHPYLLKSGQIDVEKQIVQPKSTLEKITGAPVTCFAYPFGEWNNWLIEVLQQHGFRMAFRLTDKQAGGHPLYTIRRLMVNGAWSGPQLITAMKATFK